MVWLGDSLTHTLLPGVASHVYSVAEFHELIYFGDSIAVGYRDAHDMFVTRFYIDKNGGAYTHGYVNVAGSLTAPNIYNKTQVPNLLAGKQNALIFRDPTQLNPPVQEFQL